MRDSILGIQYRNVRVINHRFHKILFLDYRRLDRVDRDREPIVPRRPLSSISWKQEKRISKRIIGVY